jgi:fibro-slime domain-containing protein
MRLLSPSWSVVAAVLGLSISGAGACARVNSGAGGGGGKSGTDGPGPSVTDGGLRPERGPVDPPPTMPPACGNGERTPDEACDDNNKVGGDGCSADCLTVEPGYSCSPAGRPCHRIARCGDGIVVLPELCDDGNATAGDGCSDTCKIELGWKCSGAPSTCSHTTCGDRVVEGAESCDDGNATPFDGCSADCQTEPNCGTGACLSKCGDGIVVGEACDDGNNIDGDGCTADCKIEPGFTCSQPALGDHMTVPIISRDFRAKTPNPDFEPSVTGQTMVVKGLVSTQLDAEGKPVFVGAAGAGHITSVATFAQWYRDTSGVNHPTVSKLTLWNNGNGAFVNRYGANGEQWPITAMAYYCGTKGQELTDALGAPIPCTSIYSATSPTECDMHLALGQTMLQCNIPAAAGTAYTAVFQTGLLDGTPVFFPVDGDPFTPVSERVAATIPPPYEATGSYPKEAGAPLHNFSFTSEVRYWFQYDGAKTYTLDFTGDDDVWVFVNKRLAVDLGAIHTPVQGSITINAANAATYGLTSGNVYEIVVFQAERQTTGSTYKLTLSGFSAAPSDCKPICGDGILGIGEECDDGVNPGGYGQCGPDCKLGEFCGDGIVQPENEDCDDGINNGHPCPSGCRILIIP